MPPGSRHVPSAPAACPCSGVLVSLVARFVFFSFFFFYFLFSPTVSSPPSPFLRVGVGEGGGGGGGFSLSSLLRKHVGSTAQARGSALVPPLGGGGCRVAPVVTLPFLRLHGDCPPWARSSRPSVSPPRRGVPGGGSAARYRHPSCPLAISPLPSPLSLVGAGGGGVGGGGVRPRCPSSGVSTSQARHWHAARHLSSCWGVRHAAWPLSLPFPRCALSPGAPPAGDGGPLPALPFPQPPPLGGRRLVGGGGFVVFLPLPSRRRHEAWLSSLCRGGGVSLVAPSVAPSILRPHPRWSPRRGLHGARPLRARSCGSSRTLLPLPPHPAALSSGGGGAFRPLPSRIRPRGGGGGGGGWGALFASPPLHARRRHVVGTAQPRGEALGCRGGGGGFPFGPSRPAPW